MVTDKGKIVADKDKQIAWLSQSCDALADEVRRLEAQIGMLKAQNDQWMASSEARHAKGKGKADLAISKNKNTLRINTTRKRKKW